MTKATTLIKHAKLQKRVEELRDRTGICVELTFPEEKKGSISLFCIEDGKTEWMNVQRSFSREVFYQVVDAMLGSDRILDTLLETDNKLMEP